MAQVCTILCNPHATHLLRPSRVKSGRLVEPLVVVGVALGAVTVQAPTAAVATDLVPTGRVAVGMAARGKMSSPGNDTSCSGRRLLSGCTTRRNS